jgi:hypothetical protein
MLVQSCCNSFTSFCYCLLAKVMVCASFRIFRKKKRCANHFFSLSCNVHYLLPLILKHRFEFTDFVQTGPANYRVTPYCILQPLRVRYWQSSKYRNSALCSGSKVDKCSVVFSKVFASVRTS